MTLDDSKHPLYATFEHLVPRNGKGPRRHNAGNTLLAHKTCNEKRGRAPVSDALFKRAEELWDAYFVWRAVPDGARIGRPNCLPAAEATGGKGSIEEREGEDHG